MDIDFLAKLTDNLGKLLGEKCEIVIHDFENGFESTIVHIVNGQLSGRTVGGCPTSLFFEMQPQISKDANDFSTYFSNTEDGRLIKSSTTFIHGANGDVAGAVCVNLDVTDFIQAQNALAGFVDYHPGERPQPFADEKFVRNVHELMNHYLEAVEEQIGKPAASMNKQEKLRALAYLDQRGVLQIAKASVKLCEFFRISKFTLYNYLEEIRSGVEAAESETEGCLE